ncbi:MAG: cyanophycinase [Acidimicrobiia bacterium]
MSAQAEANGAGSLVIIGGAEDKLGAKSILSRFVQLAGGATSRIAVIATASSLGDSTTEVYKKLFKQLGAGEVRGLRPVSREEASRPEVVGAVEDATGVFMTGGNQLRLAAVVGGTRLGQAILTAHSHGTVVGGTSAGASALSSHMVAFGASGEVPKQRMGQLSAGLGLLPNVIVDQHFGRRNRVGRLLAMVAHSPSQLGLGVDEDTAAIVDEKGILEVMGRGTVLVVDGTSLESNAFEAKRTDLLMVSGAILHVLPHGHRFDLRSRRLLPSVEGTRRPGPRDVEWPPDMELGSTLPLPIPEGADGDALGPGVRRRGHRVRRNRLDE